MKKNVLLFLFAISYLDLSAQEQKIEGKGKIIEFNAPFEKIKVEMKSKDYKNLPELPISADTKLSDSNGNPIPAQQFLSGTEIELVAEKANYKWHITSISMVPEPSKVEAKVKGTFSASETESQVFAKDITFSLGWGLGSSLGKSIPHNKSGVSWAAVGEKKLPLSLIEDFGFVTAGAYLGFKGYKREENLYGVAYTEKWKYIIIGARTAFHLVAYKKLNRWDPYIGLMLSYNFLNYDYKAASALSSASAGKGAYSSNAKPSLYVGSRYYLLKNVAAYTELGYGVSYFTLGFTFNLK